MVGRLGEEVLTKTEGTDWKDEESRVEGMCRGLQ